LNSSDALVARIDQLSQLPKDWDTYGAMPPNAFAAGWAKRAVRMAEKLKLTPLAVIPSAESGIGIAFRRGELYADLEIFNSGEILAVTSDRREFPKVWEVEASNSGIIEALRAIREYIW
jgi:hypothetical protein